jgi:hypothetical protein
MVDFVEVVGLRSLLVEWGIEAARNFEEIFSGLWETGDTERVRQIQKIVQGYFETLELPDGPTIYDHLVLSLRKEDVIATFNWDPLLIQAYVRNAPLGLSLPRLAFLHGNVRVGYCPKDRVAGDSEQHCRHCGGAFDAVPILHPIKKKNYSADTFIENEWKVLKWALENAFMVTIFGYSGPKTDEEALSAMREAWGDPRKREMEQTALIIAPTQQEEDARANWDPFIHTGHYEIQKDFYNSWIANHPRRTGEAWWNQYFEAKFIENNPLPRGADFPNLWQWYRQFKAPEESKNQKFDN